MSRLSLLALLANFYYTLLTTIWRQHLVAVSLALYLPACLFWQENKPASEPGPIELTFTASSATLEHGPSVRLSWQTSQAPQHITFTIERQAQQQTQTFLLIGRTATTTYVDSKVMWNNTYRYRVTALDKKNRVLATSPPIVVIVNDNNRLSITVLEQPPPVTSATTAVIRFASNKPAKFVCSLDNSSWQNCETSWNIYNLGQGEHLAIIRANVGAGPTAQTATTQVRWRVDTTPPIVYILEGPPSTAFAAQARLEFAANEPCRYFCRLDSAAEKVCESPWQFAPSAGEHTAQIRCVDLAGNASVSAATHAWQTQLPLWSRQLVGQGSAALAALNEASHAQLWLAHGNTLQQLAVASGNPLQTAPLSITAASLAAMQVGSQNYAASGGDYAGDGLKDLSTLWHFSLPTTAALLPPLLLPPIAAQPAAAIWPSRPYGVGVPASALVGLAAVNIDSGVELWRHPLGGGAAVAAAATQTTVGWLIFAASRQGDLYAIDASSGATVWQTWLQMPLAAAPIVVGNGAKQHVWAASIDGYIYALAATSGQAFWAAITPDGWPAVHGLAAANFAAAATQIIVASAGGRVAAIAAQTGQSVWLSDVIGPISTAPIVADVGGSQQADIIVGCSDGAIVSLDGDNGNELWRFQADSQIKNLLAVRSNDGTTLLIAATNGKVFALPTATPANIVWPQAQFNAARHGSR